MVQENNFTLILNYNSTSKSKLYNLRVIKRLCAENAFITPKWILF